MCGLVLLSVDEKPGEAVAYLERVAASPNPLPDKLLTTYAPGLQSTVELANGPRVSSGASSALAVEMLARAYDQLGRTDEAIGLLQKLHDLHPADPWVILQLCMLHAKQREWDEIVHVAASIGNDDDLTCAVVNARVEALVGQGLNDAAYEVSQVALRSKRRLPSLLHGARYLRARALRALGKLPMAHRQLEKPYAEAPGDEDVTALVRDPAWGGAQDPPTAV
jgi:tetratricopeptide (TPR) repeat protein